MEKENRKLLVSLCIVAIVTGFIYLSTGFNRALGGDDNYAFLYYRLITKDRSYLSLFTEYCKDSLYTIFHPRSLPRYFVFNYLSPVVWKFASRSILHYRVVILVYTYVAILLTALYLYMQTHSKRLSLASIALFPLLINLFASAEFNPIYSYEAIPQRLYTYWIISMILVSLYQRKKNLAYLILACPLQFAACMVLEVGYLLVFASFFIVLCIDANIKDKIILILPQALATLLAGIGYLFCVTRSGMNDDVSINIDIPAILLTAFKQIESPFAVFPVILSEFEYKISYIKIEDILLSVILGCIIIYGISSSVVISTRQM